MVVRIRKAIIPVAGLGTRMLPATKAIPKELLTIYDRPIIEHVVKEAISGGITEIILVTRSGKEAIENHFDANYELENRLEKKDNQTVLGKIKNILPEEVKVSSVRQSDALGLGHAVHCAKHLLNFEPFALLLPDVMIVDKSIRGENYSFAQLVKSWNETGLGQIMVERVDPDATNKYGIVDIKDGAKELFKSIKLTGIIEKPSKEDAPSNLAALGRYILPFRVIDMLENMEMGVGGEIQLTDALDKLLQLEDLNVIETDAAIFDCGNKLGFLGANVALGMEDSSTRKYLRALISTYDS